MYSYNTDIHSTSGSNTKTQPVSNTFEDVLKYAISINASIITKTSRGQFWYIKKINANKSFNEVKEHLEQNENVNYKKKSRTWLLKYC